MTSYSDTSVFENLTQAISIVHKLTTADEYHAMMTTDKRNQPEAVTCDWIIFSTRYINKLADRNAKL